MPGGCAAQPWFPFCTPGVAHWLSMKYEKQIAKLMKKYRKWQEVRQRTRPGLCAPGASTCFYSAHPRSSFSWLSIPPGSVLFAIGWPPHALESSRNFSQAELRLPHLLPRPPVCRVLCHNVSPFPHEHDSASPMCPGTNVRRRARRRSRSTLRRCLRVRRTTGSTASTPTSPAETRRRRRRRGRSSERSDALPSEHRIPPERGTERSDAMCSERRRCHVRAEGQ